MITVRSSAIDLTPFTQQQQQQNAWSPLHVAAKYSSENTIEMLVAAGADLLDENRVSSAHDDRW